MRICLGVLWMIRELSIRSFLRQQGIRVEAVISECGTFSTGRSYFRYVSYEFTVADSGSSKTFLRKQLVSMPKCERLAAKGKAIIAYAPDNPARSRLADTDADNESLFQVFMLMAFLGFFFVVISLSNR